MSEPRVFISYSRQQFYFAEALAFHLSKAGMNPWFDVQQLHPGSDWEAGLQRGLEASNALILVASRGALDSPYVRHEWEHALQTGKPITIALFENVSLPPELANTPCIDFRGRFDPALKRLNMKLLDPSAPSEPAERSWRVPPGVALIVLLLLSLIALASYPALAALPYVAQERYFGLNLGLFLVAGFCGVEIWRFLKRQTTPPYTTFVLVVSALAIPLLALLIQERIFKSQEIHIVNRDVYLALCAANGLLVIIGVVLLYFSADILRWMPTGQATAGHRLWVYYHRRNAGKIFSPSSTDERHYYRLFYAPPDQPAASLIISTLQEIGFYLRTDHAEDQVFIVLSNHATPELYQQTLEMGSRMVSMVISQLPDQPSVEAVSRYQWIDFRSRSPAMLKMAVQQLFLAEENAPSIAAAPVPQNFQRVVIPFELSMLTFFPRLYGAFTAALWLIMVLPSVALASKNDAGAVLIFLVLSLFIFGHSLLMFWMGNAMANRVMSRDTCSQICIGMSVVLVLVGLLAGRILIPIPYLAVYGQLRNKNTRTAAWLPARDVNPRSALWDRRGWLINGTFTLIMILAFSPVPVELFLNNFFVR